MRKAFATSFLHKVDELIRKPALLALRDSEAVCVAGTSQFSGRSRDIHLHPFLSVGISCEFCHAAYTRLGAVYVDGSICFIFGLEKLSQ